MDGQEILNRLSNLADEIYKQEKLVGDLKADYETLGEQTKNFLATVKLSMGAKSDAQAETLARASDEYKNFIHGKIEACEKYHQENARLRGLYARKDIFITQLSYIKETMRL